MPALTQRRTVSPHTPISCATEPSRKIEMRGWMGGEGICDGIRSF